MPFSRIDAIKDYIKPVVKTIMDKGTATRGTYEKARVAKCTMKYGVLCIIQGFAQNRPDRPLNKETLFDVRRIGVIVKFQLLWTMHLCKRGILTQWTRL